MEVKFNAKETEKIISDHLKKTYNLDILGDLSLSRKIVDTINVKINRKKFLNK